MKRSIFFNLLIAGLALTLVSATGCRKKAVGVTEIPGQTRHVGGSGMQDTTDMAPVLNTDATPLSMDAQNNIIGYPGKGIGRWDGRPRDPEALKADTVYFDLDSATIKNSEKSKLDRVAEYIKSNSSHDLIIEGHCDERGTENYNLSLGEKRAGALREYLIGNCGVNSDRVEIISYGEIRPASIGQGESNWSKNRRGEFVVVLPAK